MAEAIFGLFKSKDAEKVEKKNEEKKEPPEGEAAFIKKWDLDADAVSVLRKLAPDNQVKAFAGFKPHAGTQDTSGKFISWSKKFSETAKKGPIGLVLPAKRSSGENGKKEDIQPPVRTQAEMEGLAGPKAVAAFVERWSLDNTGSAMLKELPVGIRLAVLEGFSPGFNTKDYTGRLKVYIGTKLGKDEKEVSKSIAPLSVSAEAVKEFIGQWSLDKEAVKWLKELPSEDRAGVVSTFKPGPGTRDMTARLKAFAQARFKKPQDTNNTNNIKQFVAKRGFDKSAEELLRTLRPDVLDIVIREFELPLGAPNVQSKLVSFVRYASGPQYRPANGGTIKMSSVRSQSVLLGGPVGAVQKQRASGGTAKVPAKLSPQQDEKIKKWGLNEAAVQALSRLPHGLQTEVLAEFDPPADTTNMSNRFMAFVRRRSAGAGSVAAVGPRQTSPVGAPSKVVNSPAKRPAGYD